MPFRCFPIAGAISALVPAFALAGQPVIVRNPDKPLWDPARKIEFVRDLVIGDDDADGAAIFSRITDVAVDSRGRIIIADHVVRMFDSDGVFVRAIGSEGEGPGEYRYMTAVAVGPDDHVFVSGSGRICEFDADGQPVADFRRITGDYVRDLLVLHDGSLYAGAYDPPTRTVIQLYRAGKHVRGFCEAIRETGDIGTRELPSYAGGYMDVGLDGMIYYTQTTPYEIRKFTPEGELVLRVLRENDFINPPRIEKLENGFKMWAYAGSFRIVVLPDGRFLNFVGIPSGEDRPGTARVDLFDAAGKLLLSQAIDREFGVLCMDGNGCVYVADRLVGPSVVRYRTKIP